jgi:hypothetical protein
MERGEPMIYLVDIDGTIADLTHRLPLIQKEPADWDAFYMAAGEDKPIWEVITVVRALFDSGQRVIMSSGRSEISRAITVEWLRQYRVPYHGLYMRKANDHREDNVVKSELLNNITSDNPTLTVGGAFEDRQQVVDMYRARGLRVFQVAPGKF